MLSYLTEGQGGSDQFIEAEWKEVKMVKIETRHSAILRVMLLAALSALILAAAAGCAKQEGKSFNLTEKETRPVLNPAMFTGQTRMAYAAAKKIPEVMNEVYCYCYCDEPPFNHKTLLSCFTEKHGAG